MERRGFLVGAAALAGSARPPIDASDRAERTRLILLGTGGGPRPRKASSASAQVIVARNGAYVVDCGNGVARQLVFAGVPLDTLHDESVKVTAAVVHHPPVVPALAYRFDAADRSIVISGDTTPCDALVKLAQGADVLVHSALYVPAVDRLVARVPNASTLKQSIIAHQTSAEDAGRAAQAAGAKTLVLSHLVPADDPEVTEQMWIDAARTHFHGPIIVGRDLLEI